MKLKESNVKLSSHNCPNIKADSDISSNLVNPKLLSDICLAAKNSNCTVSITSAVSDHPATTTTGNVSRHASGNAVDISKINGKSVSEPSVKQITDNFVNQLKLLGYVLNNENNNPKSVLWQMAGHTNHVHVSNMEKNSETSNSEVTSSPETSPSPEEDDASNIMNGLIGATFGRSMGLKEEINRIKSLL